MQSMTGVVPQEHWQPTQSAKVCQYQDCGDEFGFFSSKYSCHRCGIVLCKKCAANPTTIPGYYRNNAVPVCPRCYQVIQRFKQRGPSTPGYVVHSTTVSTAATRNSPQPTLQQPPTHPSITTPAQQAETTDFIALQNVINALQNEINEQQRKAANDASASTQEIQSLREENSAMKETLQLIQTQIKQQDAYMGKASATASELQRHLDAATRERDSLAQQAEQAQQQRAQLEAQVAQLAQDNAAVREQLSANASELQRHLDAATRERDSLAQQAEQAEQLVVVQEKRDVSLTDVHKRGAECVGEACVSREVEIANEARDNAFRQFELSTRRCEELEGQITRLQADVAHSKAALQCASEKASALMSRLTTLYGVPIANSIATMAADDGTLVVGASAALPVTLAEEDAALIAEVGHRLREREEAMRLLAEGVELRERARPLERILAVKLEADKHLDSVGDAKGMDSVVATAAFRRAGALAMWEAHLSEREMQLSEKERQLLRVAHELQAKSRALQVLYRRTVEREEEEARAPAQLPPAAVTPPRALLMDDSYKDHQSGKIKDESEEAAPPPPRPPPRTPMQAATHASTTSTAPPQQQDVEEKEEATQKRLAAATEAYRDVLFAHILETNGLQGSRSLAQYLQGPQVNNGEHTNNNSDRGANGMSDMACRTRAMLRALEERLDGSRSALRGVDPAVQKRSLEAFRKLEKAVRSLCEAGLER